ncbi:hypothetical protein [Nocardia brasiliensis]|uniref:hypothetical protein n=1 Tax=Nocardia brasiliensis TaxID=37326 RepID=UPI0018954BE2|nr:hypothetical protein [Nocardia brasiliensis]MBF6547322.1 hypothetical protein [Nocardia brasiliensis]
MDGWYVLEAGAPHRYRVPWDDELPVAVPAGVALDEHYFRGFLIYRAWRGQWFLRLRWSARPPVEADRPVASDDCLLAVGPMNEVVVEIRRTVDGRPRRYRVARRGAADSSSRTVRFDLGRAVTARPDEIFDVEQAGALFLAYYRAGTVPDAEYTLRELDSAEGRTEFGVQTHVLTVDYGCYRPVLATVAEGEFAALLPEAEEDPELGDESAVLVLATLPPGRAWADLDDEEVAGSAEFLQVAGSGGRYLVEWRLWDGAEYRQFAIGRHATSPVETVRESLRQRGEWMGEIQNQLAELAVTVDLIDLPTTEWATISTEVASATIVSSDAATPQPVPEPSTDNTSAPPDEPLAPVIPLRAPEPGVVDQGAAAPAVVDRAVLDLSTVDLPVEDPVVLDWPVVDRVAQDRAAVDLAAEDRVAQDLAVVDPAAGDTPALDSVPQITPPPTADVPIHFDNYVEYVYPNEVFAPAEVDVLLLHYCRAGRLPELGFSYREIALER